MRALVLQADKRSNKVQEVPKPTVQPGTLLLKTIYCAICGTDIEYVDGVLQMTFSDTPVDWSFWFWQGGRQP